MLLPLIINKRRSWSSKLGSFKLGVVYFFLMRCALILENGMSNLDMYSVITAFFLGIFITKVIVKVVFYRPCAHVWLVA